MNHYSKNKQEGVTLITSMLLLVIMTIVGVSATKVSSMDVLIAGHDQQQMLLAQNLNSKLHLFASVETLEKTLTTTGFTPSAGETNKYVFSQASNDGYKVDKEVTDLGYKYTCKRNGEASDIGPDAPNCDLYDFHIGLKRISSNAKDTRHQGSGKMVPSKQHADDATKGDYSFAD